MNNNIFPTQKEAWAHVRSLKKSTSIQHSVIYSYHEGWKVVPVKNATPVGKIYLK